MSPKGHIPIRRCMGCGTRRKKGEMIRFFKTEQNTVSIYPGDHPGRGYYLCPNRSCFEKAHKKGRGIRFQEPPDLTILRSLSFRRESREEKE